MRTSAVAVAVGVLLNLVPIPGETAPFPSRAGGPGAESAQDLAVIEAALETRIVQETLGRLGVDPQELKDRLSRLSPSERHQLAAESERLLAGGQDRVTLLIVLILLILLIALLI